MEPESAAAQAAGAGPRKRVEEREEVVIRFAGDSGDGMQLAGMHFTNETALAGNDLSTLPDFPAEIRAPAGTLAGVSGFQLHFSSRDVFTPAMPRRAGGDEPGGAEGEHRRPRGERHPHRRQGAVQRAEPEEGGVRRNPLTDGSLDRFQVFPVDITKLTINALKDMGLPTRTMMRSRNFFALGLTSWLFGRRSSRPSNGSSTLQEDSQCRRGEHRCPESGLELRRDRRDVPHRIYRPPRDHRARPLSQHHRQYGHGARLRRRGAPRRPAALPRQLPDHTGQRHPARALDAEEFRRLHLPGRRRDRRHRRRLGAAFGGAIALTTTSGPGVCLKAEALNLALSTELPLIIADIQRGGPSTGLPTKTEQADLLLAMFGRNSDSPIPILAPATPATASRWRSRPCASQSPT